MSVLKLPATATDAALRDPFCQLPNRTALRIAVQQALVTADATGRGFMLASIGLDSLNEINTRYGMATGDAYLYAWAQRLRKRVEGLGNAFYVFGSQFAVVIPQQGERAAWTQRIAAEIRQWQSDLSQPFDLAEKSLSLSLTIGIVRAPGDGRDFDELMANAHAARQEAQRLGNDELVLYSPGEHTERRSQLELVSDLNDAIEEERFELHYQPIVNARERRVCSLEALMRWQHPRHGLLSPAHFIELAEETGLIGRLGQLCLRTLLKDRETWRQAEGPRSFAFNVSPRELADHGYVESVDKILNAGVGPVDGLEIEVTENVMVQYPERCARVLRRLKSRGFEIVIDDFGSGYASLFYLNRFPVDKIKIDRLYVDNLTNRHKERALITASVQLAHDLNASVVAEGVETAEQMDLLQRLGCYLMQGYHFCRPQPLEEILAWTQAWEAGSND